MIINLDVELSRGGNKFNYKLLLESSITGIYGASGAGKTTLLNIIAGIEQPDSGFMAINDKLVVDIKSKYNIPCNKRGVAYIFQEGRLFPHLTVKENLLFSNKYLDKSKIEIKLNDVLDLLKIKPLINKKPMELSGGEKQRVAIGRALLSQPKLLLLDEPFSNLDRSLRKQIISYLLKINTTYKIPMLIVSHIIGDILRLTNSLAIIDNGRVVAQGDFFNIMANSLVPEIIKPHRYLNVIDTTYTEKSTDNCLYTLVCKKCNEISFNTENKKINSLEIGTNIRLAIRPDEIALSKNKLNGVSIQNQIKGRVNEIFENENSTFCVVKCNGIELVSEITKNSLLNLNITVGAEVWCLIKSKSIEIIYDI